MDDESLNGLPQKFLSVLSQAIENPNQFSSKIIFNIVNEIFTQVFELQLTAEKAAEICFKIVEVTNLLK